MRIQAGGFLRAENRVTSRSSQCVGDRAGQDDSREDGAEIPEHKVEHRFAAEGLTFPCDLFLDLFHTDDPGDQQAGGNGRNGHHHRVGQEVEEIKELHSEHGHAGKGAVAQRGKAAQCDHNTADEDGGAGAVPAQLVLKGRNSTLGQGNGAGEGREQHQHKEEHAYGSAHTHAGKDLGDGDEHQAGPACRVSGSPPEKAKTAGMIIRPA